MTWFLGWCSSIAWWSTPYPVWQEGQALRTRSVSDGSIALERQPGRRFAAFVEAADEQGAWALVKSHFPDAERRFARWREDDKPALIRTYTGLLVNPLELQASQVRSEDIGRALANLCRFGGHLRTFYSVAQHSVLVSRLVPRPHALAGLLHDAAEAYLLDIPAPIKHLPELEGYCVAEERAFDAIAEAFALPMPLDPSVALADKLALLYEDRDIRRLVETFDGDARVVPVGPDEAFEQFMQRLDELTG